MSHHLAVAAAAIITSAMCGACGPDTTSFRTTERSDPHHAGPPSATYDVYQAGQLIAKTHVWSTGGYISSAGESMCQIGFEISNTSAQVLQFDSDVLDLAVFDSSGAALPRARFTSITPLGPALVGIPSGQTVVLAAYFLLPVRPRVVDKMQVRWTLRSATDEYRQITGFVRDDDAPILDYVPPADPRWPRS